MKITQKPHLDAQMELEQQAHMFVMQAFDLQNREDSPKITKITPSCSGRLQHQAHMSVIQAFDIQNSKGSTKIKK